MTLGKAMLVMVVAVVCSAIIGATAGLYFAKRPVYDYEPRPLETSVLAPSDMFTGFKVEQPTVKSVTAVRVRVRSKSPVHVGFMPTVLAPAAKADRGVLGRSVTLLRCVKTNVLDAEVDCAFLAGDLPQSLFVIDARHPADALTGGALAFLGIVKGPAEDAMVRNDVTVTFSDYRCVKNC